eukprot:tig00001310_g8151.t1
MRADDYSRFGIALVDGETLVVSEEDNALLRRVRISTGEVTTLVGVANSPGSADGVGTAARLQAPGPMQYHAPRDTLYILQRAGGASLRKVVYSTLAVSTVAAAGALAGKALEHFLLDPAAGRALVTVQGPAGELFSLRLDLNRTAPPAAPAARFHVGPGAAVLLAPDASILVGG